jgi:hypothetical protein
MLLSLCSAAEGSLVRTDRLAITLRGKLWSKAVSHPSLSGFCQVTRVIPLLEGPELKGMRF